MSSSDEITLQQPGYTVQHESTPAGGRYYITLGDGLETAELTWRHSDNGSITAEHTYVPPSHRGHGLANLLVARLMDDARTNGWRLRLYTSDAADDLPCVDLGRRRIL